MMKRIRNISPACQNAFDSFILDKEGSKVANIDFL